MAVWPEKKPDDIAARIDREWTALGHDPTLAEPICWFERADGKVKSWS